MIKMKNYDECYIRLHVTLSSVGLHMALTGKKFEHYRKSPTQATCFKDRLLRTSWPLSVKVYLVPLQTCSNHETNGFKILGVLGDHLKISWTSHTHIKHSMTLSGCYLSKIMLNDHRNELKWRPVQTTWTK